MHSHYKREHSLKVRQSESTGVRERYPDRVPVICETHDAALSGPTTGKYLVPADIAVSQFIHIVRSKIKLQADTALFMFVCNTIPPQMTLMSQLDRDHRDADGFLYMEYTLESTFGGA